MRFGNGAKGFFAAVLFAAGLAGCQQATETSNTVANANGNSTVNINSNSNANMTNSTVTTNTGQVIEAR